VSAGGERIRAFVALDLDSTSVRRVVRVADRLRMESGAPSASWTPAARLHVTLKFMGALPVDAVVPIGQALVALAATTAPPSAGAARLEAFPSPEHASVVVLELEDPGGGIAQLAARFEALAREHGVERETRAFRPHVTLARLKRPYDARRWLRAALVEAAGECRAARLTLYRSETRPDGALYVPLATGDLAGA
jgi:2'-5' RNA ligase